MTPPAGELCGADKPKGDTAASAGEPRMWQWMQGSKDAQSFPELAHPRGHG